MYFDDGSYCCKKCFLRDLALYTNKNEADRKVSFTEMEEREGYDFTED